VIICDIPARVRHEWPSIPGCYELKGWKVVASAETCEWFVDAGHADAVGYIDDARQLLELGEELRSDGCACVSIADEWNLGGGKCGGEVGES